MTADINTTFTAQRHTQISQAAARQADIDARIAAGTLVPLGGDRYRINDPQSFDHNETLTYTAGQLLPQHGLDLSLGQAALYTSTPAWHSLGNVIPGGTSDVAQVLTLGGIGFDVIRRPAEYRRTVDGGHHMVPGYFITVRTDTEAPLGVVGSKYHVLQNADIFGFLQDLADTGDIVWESAGALRDGRTVFVCMRLPDTLTIDAAGISDTIIPFIMATNTHDGSRQAEVVTTPWRPVCANTERFALRDAYTRWGVRHTRNARSRIEEARRTLGLTRTYYQQFAAEQETLARTRMAITEFHDLIEDLWPATTGSKRETTSRQRRKDVLTGLFAANTGTLGNTCYAAERAITEYCDWHKTVRPTGSLRGKHLAARATLAVEGGNDTIKTKAHKALLTLTRR